MKNLLEKYNNLLVEAEKIIASKVNKIGTKSEFSSNKTIKIVDENYMFNLGSSNWLVELLKDRFIDNYGHEWYFNNLNGEEFFALAVYIKGLKK